MSRIYERAAEFWLPPDPDPLQFVGGLLYGLIAVVAIVTAVSVAVALVVEVVRAKR